MKHLQASECSRVERKVLDTERGAPNAATKSQTTWANSQWLQHLQVLNLCPRFSNEIPCQALPEILGVWSCNQTLERALCQSLVLPVSCSCLSRLSCYLHYLRFPEVPNGHCPQPRSKLLLHLQKLCGTPLNLEVNQTCASAYLFDTLEIPIYWFDWHFWLVLNKQRKKKGFERLSFAKNQEYNFLEIILETFSW